MSPLRERLPLPLHTKDFLDPRRAALVMWDMQNGLAGRAPRVGSIRDNALKLLEAAERHGLPVIWSRHVLPPLHLTTGPFLLFLMKKQKVDHPDKLVATMQSGMEDTNFIDGLMPKPHHIVLEKSQPSLFVDTPLDLRLKTLGIDTLIICGVATDIGIEFTCRHAAALGYFTVAVEDASGAYSDEAHERSLAFLRNWITPVVNTATVCQTLDEPR
ncbi:MAG TPA: isochorismatase family cysteine hydrolase [Pseudolabrys sp.]